MLPAVQPHWHRWVFLMQLNNENVCDCLLNTGEHGNKDTGQIYLASEKYIL